MTPTIAIALLCLFLVGLIWISVSKASEDGFFISLCTLLVLFSAYQVAHLEWDFFYSFLLNQGLNRIQAISMGYWVGFLIIVAPGLVLARVLGKPKVPFPSSMEQYGSGVAGAAAGILLFAVLIQWLWHADLLPNTFVAALRTFRPIFFLLGYRSEGFE